MIQPRDAKTQRRKERFNIAKKYFKSPSSYLCVFASLRLCVKFFIILISLSLFSFSVSLQAATSPPTIKTLYTTLDPASVSQHLAFYRLFPETAEGKKALNDAWNLLNLSAHLSSLTPLPLPDSGTKIQELVSLVNRPPQTSKLEVSEEELKLIDSLAVNLSNRSLKGFWVESEEEALALPSTEIDLARALFLSQIPPSKDQLKEVRSYEALFDLMALQILARLPKNATPYEKIGTINRFIFDEMRFRFPPHSLYAKEVDTYTFLPSVLDSRRGVCLGVSILYLCIAQRLNLPLEPITPPGHIYLRYVDQGNVINIETTNRGVNMPSEMYLSIDTRKLQKRTIKEVVGMAYVNQASVFWQKEDFAQAVTAYQTALKYVPDDPLIKELLGYNYLFLGEEEKGKALLESIKEIIPDYAVSKQNVAEDILLGHADAKGVLSLFKHVDETRASIEEKKGELIQTLARTPKFRSGWFALAITWLQLGRPKEALQTLEQVHALSADDATTEYYLAVLYAERYNLPKAWEHFKLVKGLTQARDHNPLALQELELELLQKYPP